MEITIKLTGKEAKHLESPHTFMDECEPACNVLNKVQKEINKMEVNKNGKRKRFKTNKKNN